MKSHRMNVLWQITVCADKKTMVMNHPCLALPASISRKGITARKDSNY